jgi:phosphatidylglycerol:prolipoprotein diacylglycerol transferase
MIPEIHIGPITIQTFGLMFAIGFLVAGAWLWQRLGEIGKPPDWAYEMGFSAMLGGLVGSRLYWLVDNADSLQGSLFNNLFSGSGLTWYGGVIGGAIAVILWAWYRDFLNLALLDMAGVALLLGQAIGRIGCQLSGDGDYGKPWDGPWAMSYPNGVVPTEDKVHPTPVYETLALGLGAYILWRFRDRVRPGLLFAGYLLWGGTTRFLVEFLRRNDPVAIGLTVAQWISLAMMVAGAVWLVVVWQRHGSLIQTAPELTR